MRRKIFGQLSEAGSEVPRRPVVGEHCHRQSSTDPACTAVKPSSLLPVVVGRQQVLGHVTRPASLEVHGAMQAPFAVERSRVAVVRGIWNTAGCTSGPLQPELVRVA